MIRQTNLYNATGALRSFVTELTNMNAEERKELLENVRKMGSGTGDSLATVLVTKAVYGAIEKLK
jgi:hypothetical protein